MVIGHVVPDLRPAQGNWWCSAKKGTTPVANCSVVGESRLKPPPPKKNTDTALCYVCCVLPLAVPLDRVWRGLRVLRVFGVASGTASGI